MKNIEITTLMGDIFYLDDNGDLMEPVHENLSSHVRYCDFEELFLRAKYLKDNSGYTPSPKNNLMELLTNLPGVKAVVDLHADRNDNQEFDERGRLIVY